ncbi:unnamed protein product [Urochloa humidicola]
MGLGMGRLLGLSYRLRKQLQARILMLGLDAAGKATILCRLKTGEVASTIIATITFKIETIEYAQAASRRGSRCGVAPPEQPRDGAAARPRLRSLPTVRARGSCDGCSARRRPARARLSGLTAAWTHGSRCGTAPPERPIGDAVQIRPSGLPAALARLAGGRLARCRRT